MRVSGQRWAVSLVALCVAAGLSLSMRVSPAGAKERWDGLATTVFQNFGRDQGLPHPVPTALAQDRDGFLWVGLQGGLARWDGYRFRSYRANPAIPGSLHDDWVSILHVAGDGQLWVGGGAGGLARYDKLTDQFHPVALNASTERMHIGAITDDRVGGLWVGTDDGLYRLPPTSRPEKLAADGLPPGPVRSVRQGDDGTLWVGGSFGLVRRAKGDNAFTTVPIPADSLGVSALAQDREGRLWIGTRRRGLFVLEQTATIPAAVGAGTGLDKRGVSTIVVASPGEIWAGVRGSGLWAVDIHDRQVRPMRHDRTVPGSLMHDDVWSSLRDDAGSIWIGTSLGLSYHPHDPGIISTIYGGSQRPEGLSGTDVLSILPLRNGLIWVGYLNNGAEQIDPMHGRVVTLKPDAASPEHALPPSQVSALAEGPDGTVWFGTRHGLYARDPHSGRLRLVPVPGRQPHGAVASLNVDHDILWVGGEEDGLWGFRPGPQSETILAGTDITLADHCINVIHRGSGNDLWVGTRDGLYRIDIATRTVDYIGANPADPQALPGRYIVSLLRDGQGRLWVGTFGGGIAVLTGRDTDNRPRFQRLGLDRGLPHLNVGSMQMDSTGTIWAGTDDGLAMIDPEALTARSVRRSDGAPLLDYVAGAGATDATGAVLFGALGGMTVARPGTFPQWRFRPPVVVTDLRVGGVPVPVGRYNGQTDPAPLILTPDTNSLAVEFASLDFTAPERNRYAYKLEGFDRDWVQADVNRRLAIYTNLAPGDYHLRLRGTNRAGMPAAGDMVLPVRVLPAWYQNRWAQALAGVLALAGIFGLVRWRTSLLRRRQSYLEQQIADRTADLRAANERLERLAMTDPLTGCANRRHFMQRAAETVALATRHGTPLSLAVLDLDDFKQVNDTHGHPAGDAVLVMAGRLLAEHMRATDLVGRVGGEEFALLMPHTDAAGAMLLAGRLCAALQASRVTAETGQMAVTASIGVAELHPDDDLDRLYARADTALYAAKQGGRNRVVLAPGV